MSASSLVEMIWKGKRAQSQVLCFSNLPVARAHSSCALQRHSGLVKFPAISSSLQGCIQGKQQAVTKLNGLNGAWNPFLPLLHVWEERAILPTRKLRHGKEVGGLTGGMCHVQHGERSLSRGGVVHKALEDATSKPPKMGRESWVQTVCGTRKSRFWKGSLPQNTAVAKENI